MVYISDFKTLVFYNPSLKIYLLVILFSMAGLPPFITAFTKWYILIILLNKYYVVLCGISVIFTIFSIYYYVRLIKHIFFENYMVSDFSIKPLFYFNEKKGISLFLIMSALLLGIGPVIIYGYVFDFLNIFWRLGDLANFNFPFSASISTIFVIFSHNIMGYKIQRLH